jgi:ABC-type phosphate/phosphonate transport system permease subunit
MRVDEVVGKDVVLVAMRVVGTAMSVPVVVGFVALGAAVLIGRSVRGTARRLVGWARDVPPDAGAGSAKAA